MLIFRKPVQDKSRAAIVFTAAVLYLFFALSHVWYLPNYNLLRLGRRFVASSHTTFKAASRRGNYNTRADKGIWLEKVSKTTPVSNRSSSLVLIGAAATITAMLLIPRILPTDSYRQNRGYDIFAHQYAYLSLRTFRI